MNTEMILGFTSCETPEVAAVCFLFGCLLFPAAFTKNVLAELRPLVTSFNKNL